MSAFDRVVFALQGVPCSHVFVAFSEGDVAEAEPKQQPPDGEPMLRRDQEGVHDHEACEEVHAEQKLAVAEASESSVTIY